MKKYIFLLAMAGAMASCGGNKAEMDRMQAKLDSLDRVNQNAKAEIDLYLGDFNDIQSNLDEIKTRQGIVTMNSNVTGELTEDAKTRITNDLQLIQQLMDENKQKIESLNKKVRSGDTKMKEFEKLIASLQKSIEEKDAELGSLREQLAMLDSDFKNLTASYEELQVENVGNKSTIEQQTAELNTVFYAMGTFKELTNNKVLDKGGAFATKTGAKLSSDVNIDYFTKADKRNISEITIGSKKASLKTSHPNGSYKMEGADGKIDKLVITDPSRFWQNSRYLVIQLN